MKSDLRIDGGQFEKNLRDSRRSDGRPPRFSRFYRTKHGPVLSKEADYDPQSAVYSAPPTSLAFNDYVRKTLGYGQGKSFKPEIDVGKTWELSPPAARRARRQCPSILNVMPDLASAMKYNPDLKVMVVGGYFDLATPYYRGMVRDAPFADPRGPAVKYRIPLLPVRPHGLRQRAVPQSALHDNVSELHSPDR